MNHQSKFEKLTAPALLYLAFWFVIAVVAASTAFIALRGTSLAQWFGVFGIMLEYFYVWAAIALGIYFLQRRMAARASSLTLQAGIHIVLLVAILLLMPFAIHGADWADWLYGDRATAFHALNIVIYAFVLIGCKALDYYRVIRAREAELFAAELRRVELERSLESSRMDALRAQINPHFLFNALNSLASLIESKSNRDAYEVVERLAALLRVAFDYSRDRVVTLREELEFLDAYLAIEKIRFADRLQVIKSVPDDCLDIEVPSFSLQPLVENAIKHAVSGTSEPVTIRIEVSRTNGTLQVAIADDGPGLGETVTPGVGLANVQSRLKHLFGDAASVDLRNGDNGGTRVALLLPA